MTFMTKEMTRKLTQFAGRWGSPLAIAMVLTASATTSFAQSQDPSWLRSIDELMDVEVSSAARRERRLSDTAAAAFVLTRDDIRRSGLDDVPSLLRLVPGVQVGQINAHTWAVTVRGFNSRWANKLLVMIDGQSVYSDVFSGVYWDALDVPIDSIERIEVVRGPGGSLWGANAVNGIINIITRTSATDGGALTATVGGFGLSTASARYGSSIGTRVRYHTYFGGGDQQAVDPQVTVDDWNRVRFGGGVTASLSSRDSVDLQVTAHHGMASYTGSVVLSAVPLRREIREMESVNDTMRAAAKWTRTLQDGGTLQGAATWLRNERDDAVFSSRSDTVEFSFQHVAGRRGRHELTWGASFRQSDVAMTDSPTFGMTPAAVNQAQRGFFAQDDIGFAADRVVVTLGAKAESFTHTGWHLQPTARALWHLSPRQSVWAATSRAVRTPSLSERGMFVNIFEVPGRVPMIAQLFGNPHVRHEALIAYEAGYRWTAPKVSLDVAAYRNDYSDAINLETGVPYFVGPPQVPHLVLPVVFDNKQQVSAAGGEVSLTVSASPRWRLVANYGLFTVRSRFDADSRNFATAAYDAATPRHQGAVRSLFVLPRRLDADATVYWVGRIDSDNVPAYARLDARLGWRALATLDIALLGRNILDSRHVEFTSSSTASAITTARRQIAVTSTWRF